MLILGIDPGMGTTGWGLVRGGGDRYDALAFGAILTPPKLPMAERLKFLAAELRGLVERLKPEAAAVEELFIAKDSRTAASVGHGRGALLLTLAQLGLPIHEYNPRHVKMALTGYGAADKSQMQHMVQRLLRLTVLPKPDDAADALAIALCHINTARGLAAPAGKGYTEAWVKAVLEKR